MIWVFLDSAWFSNFRSIEAIPAYSAVGWTSWQRCWMQTCNPFKALSSRGEYQNIISAKMNWTWLTTDQTPFIAATGCRPLYGRDTIDSWPRRLLCFPSVTNEWYVKLAHDHFLSNRRQSGVVTFLNELQNLPSYSPLNTKKTMNEWFRIRRPLISISQVHW